MDFQSLQFIKRSASIVLKNYFLLIFPVALGYFLYIPDPRNVNISNIIGVFLLLLCYLPLAYGYLFEVSVNNQRLSFYTIFKKHWLNVILVSLLFLITCFFISFYIMQNIMLQFLFLLVAKVSIIYVIPLVYFKGVSFDNIIFGFKCFFGNLSFNTPLVTLSFSPMFFAILLVGLTGKSNIQVHILVCVFEFFVNFVLFTSAVLILQEKVIE